MLLFSTILNIKEGISADELIRLVLKWNETSKYEENKVTGIAWNGEHNIKFGTPGLWLEVIEYPEKHILAIRHEKVAADGVIWDSDFIMNFADMRLAVQLDRTYSEDALVMNANFSTPHFITLLIENDFLAEDEDIPVIREPVFVTDKEEGLLADVFTEKSDYRLPVVYVSKTADGRDPLSISWLASRLKGAAHVLVEKSPEEARRLRELCGGTREMFGAVRIYYPSASVRRKKYLFRTATGNEETRLEKVIRNVIHYWVSQRIEPLYTWQGVLREMLNEQLSSQITKRMEAEAARQKAENEIDQVYDEFDEDLQALQEKVAELTKANEALQYENQGLRAKLAEVDAAPLLFMGEEEDFYQGEIRDIVLGAIDDASGTMESATRRADVLEDILENNPYRHLSDERKQRVKSLFKGYKTVSGTMKQELADMGFELTEAGKHYKLTYRGDPRYLVTVGKTPSDNRSGSNTAAAISKTML